MRKEINDAELNDVAGGIVFLSKDYNMVGFSTLQEDYKLNCTYREARDLRDDLLEANPGISDSDFDVLVKNAFISKGWI